MLLSVRPEVPRRVFAATSGGKDAFHLAATVMVHEGETLAAERTVAPEMALDLARPKNIVPEALRALRDVSPYATRTGAPPSGEAGNDQLQTCLVR